MSGLEQLLVVLAGLGAGIATSSIGVASLVSFPVLIAIGVPPVAASSSNTVGLVPAGVSGTFAYRRELAGRRRLVASVMVLSGASAVAGALLLLISGEEKRRAYKRALASGPVEDMPVRALFLGDLSKLFCCWAP